MRMVPERVARLALLDTSARADTPDRTEQRRVWVADAKRGDFKAVVERHLPLYLPEHRLKNDPDLVDRVPALGLRRRRRGLRAPAKCADPPPGQSP